MYTMNKQFLLTFLLIFIFSAYVNAACTPTGTPGDDNVVCTGDVNGWQEFYGGSDRVELNNVTNSNNVHSPSVYWLDESNAGNPATDGNDTFIAHNSAFNWVFGFNGNDLIEIYDSNFSNVYADTNPNWVNQRGDDTIVIENSVSNGWILGGNDNDSITIKDSRVSFVASGYSDILSDIPGYIDYTPYDGNDTIILDNVDFSEMNYWYNGTDDILLPGAIGTGKADDLILFKNGGNAYGVSAGHGNDQIIVEDDMHFNDCNYTNERGNMTYCGIYGDEPYESEVPDGSTLALHGNDELIILAGDLSGIVVEMGHGSDTTVFSDGVELLDTNISGGDDRSIMDGFVDRLVFDSWSGDLNGSQLQNWETIVFDNNSEITFLDDNLSSGFESGRDAVTNLPYGLVLQNNASWKIMQNFLLDGNLYNEAIVDMQADGNRPDTVLTIANNYSGSSGEIALDIVLNDASTSISDTLVIEGDASGTTLLRINNVNGSGGQTPTGDNEGILVVEVHGNSADDAFQLASTPMAGEYAYKLVKGSNGNWYLQSVDTIDALDARLAVDSYSEHRGQLPPPGTGTTCLGPFTYVLTEDVKHGDLTLDPSTGSYSYLPEADYYGMDTFSYQIRSEQCDTLSNVATVTIAVECATSQSSDSGDAFSFMGLFLLLTGMMSAAWYSLKPRY